jgi:hypothetical protein
MNHRLIKIIFMIRPKYPSIAVSSSSSSERIVERCCNTSCYKEIDRKLQYAIFLLNFGVASKRIVETFDEELQLLEDEQMDLRDQSIQLFEMAYTIANKLVTLLPSNGQLPTNTGERNNSTWDVDGIQQIQIQIWLIDMFTSAHMCDVTSGWGYGQ